MTSTPKGSTNAQLDLSTYSMNVKGIKSVLISDSNFVVIFPRSDSLIERKIVILILMGKFLQAELICTGQVLVYSMMTGK